ncbi:MAG TPA: hypothetical protein VFX96_14455 [Pyrinomonadaceae bacterium]|nr:hypothetical protein [Pyrinomonadaceae bacterium]
MKIRLSLVLALGLLFAAAWGAALYFNITRNAARADAPSSTQRSESR